MSWKRMRTKQDVNLSFCLKDGVNKELSSKEAKELNELITDIVYDEVEGDFFNIDVNFWDYGFDDIEGETLDNQTEYSFTIRFYIIVEGSYYYSPAVMYLSNGDPGYPAEEDWEPCNGWIESINKSNFIKRLCNLPYIGNLIDESTVSVVIDDYDEDGIWYD